MNEQKRIVLEKLGFFPIGEIVDGRYDWVLVVDGCAAGYFDERELNETPFRLLAALARGARAFVRREQVKDSISLSAYEAQNRKERHKKFKKHLSELDGEKLMMASGYVMAMCCNPACTR